MRKKISQLVARRLQKRVDAFEVIFEDQRRVWGQEYFHAVNIASLALAKEHDVPIAVRTARKLGHAVVVLGDDGGGLRFMALPHPKMP